MKLDWPQCRNARDLGGIPTADGQIRAGALIRSDNLDQLDDSGLAAVRAAGVSRIVDLRSVWECEKYPSPFADDPIWLNVPLTDPADEDVSTAELLEQYRILIDEHPQRFATAVKAIAEAPAGCVVVACHAGKDRTGLVIAITLALAGVPVEAIAADYETLAVPLAGTLPEAAPPRGETISKILDHLQNRYGGVHGYLAVGGLTPEQLGSLTSRLR